MALQLEVHTQTDPISKISEKDDHIKKTVIVITYMLYPIISLTIISIS